MLLNRAVQWVGGCLVVVDWHTKNDNNKNACASEL